MKKIIALSGSLRKGSFNTALLKIVTQLPLDQTSIEIASLQDIPLYNGDIEELSGIPKSVQLLKDKIAISDGLLICTPEYNRSIPGVLKNAIDWLSRPTNDIPRVFGNKPTALMGSAASFEGSAYSQTAWLPVFKYLNVNPYFEKTFSLGSSFSAFDEKGQLKDPKVHERLKAFIAGFVHFIDHH